MKILEVLTRFLRTRASATRARAVGARRPFDSQFFAAPAPQARGRAARRAGGSQGTKDFPFDPSLPQLKVAGNPEAMREVFRAHLVPFDGRIYDLQECQITHTRYRMSSRCLLQYTLLLTEASTGQERSQWVTGLMLAGGRTRQLWEGLQRSRLAGEATVASPPFAPFSYIPDLDMLVQVFPYDRQLPALPLIMACPSAEIEPLLLSRFGPGNWRTEGWEVEPVRYLTEKRATLRLTVKARNATTGRVEEKCFYAKIYQGREQGKLTSEALQALTERADAGGEGFIVGRPIAYLDDLRTLLQEEVRGTSLKHVLRDKDEALPAVRKVARALAALHLDDHITTARHHSLQDEAADLARAGRSLKRSLPHLEPRIEETIAAVISGLKEVPPSPTHGDLKPVHIMLDAECAALIDLDDFAGADPVLDVARLLVPLSDAPLGSASQVDLPIARTFIEEYFAHVPTSWRARLPFHYASAVLKVAAGRMRHQPPGWQNEIETLIEEARNSVAGKVW